MVSFIGSVGAGGGGLDGEAVGCSGSSNPAAEAIADTGSPRSNRRAALNAPSADLGAETFATRTENSGSMCGCWAIYSGRNGIKTNLREKKSSGTGTVTHSYEAPNKRQLVTIRHVFWPYFPSHPRSAALAYHSLAVFKSRVTPRPTSSINPTAFAEAGSPAFAARR